MPEVGRGDCWGYVCPRMGTMGCTAFPSWWFPHLPLRAKSNLSSSVGAAGTWGEYHACLSATPAPPPGSSRATLVAQGRLPEAKWRLGLPSLGWGLGALLMARED